MMQAAASAAPVVFVVDDDFDVREVLKSLLESVGLRAEVFGSTREFLQHKPMDTVSCLVLDVSLPGVSGLDFQAELAGTHADIPIIFLSGHADTRLSVRAMKAGAVAFLTKPVREQDLFDAINAAFERDRTARRAEDYLAAGLDQRSVGPGPPAHLAGLIERRGLKTPGPLLYWLCASVRLNFCTRCPVLTSAV